jgi:hypothetical protein
MYTPHPELNRLRVAAPIGVWNARKNVQAIEFSDLVGMRDTVDALADEVIAFNPNFVPFFATGSIPYVFPLMWRLRDRHQEGLLDGTTFHMFPGLSWDGKIGTMTSAELFLEEAVPILRGLAASSGRVAILLMDTTNVGNAVNKATKSIVDACVRAGTAAELRIIGIVNQSANGSNKIGTRVKLSTGEHAYVRSPSGYELPEEVSNREFIKLVPPLGTDQVRTELAYWVLKNVFTEDIAELVEAFSIEDTLQVNADASAGRIRVTFPNGASTLVASGESVGLQLSHLISKGPEDRMWQILQQRDALPPEQGSDFDDLDRLYDQVLQTFEIDEDPNAINAILKKKSLWTAAEIRALMEEKHFGAETVAKVNRSRSSRLSDRDLEEAVAMYMTSARSMQRDSCHESGHAVARYLNGDTLISIDVHRDGLTEDDRVPGERGNVIFRRKEIQCQCGGYVRSSTRNHDSDVSFNRGCPDCEEHIAQELTAIYAGGAATSKLMPDDHVPQDSSFDEESAKELLNRAVQLSRQSAVGVKARRGAVALIETNRHAVIQLRDLLVDHHGSLDGVKARELLDRLFEDESLD